MTRYSPSVLLTPDPEGSLFDLDEVNKRVKEAEEKALADLYQDLQGMYGTVSKFVSSAEAKAYNQAIYDVRERIRSRNEEGK